MARVKQRVRKIKRAVRSSEAALQSPSKKDAEEGRDAETSSTEKAEEESGAELSSSTEHAEENSSEGSPKKRQRLPCKTEEETVPEPIEKEDEAVTKPIEKEAEAGSPPNPTLMH